MEEELDSIKMAIRKQQSSVKELLDFASVKQSESNHTKRGPNEVLRRTTRGLKDREAFFEELRSGIEPLRRRVSILSELLDQVERHLTFYLIFIPKIHVNNSLDILN